MRKASKAAGTSFGKFNGGDMCSREPIINEQNNSLSLSLAERRSGWLNLITSIAESHPTVPETERHDPMPTPICAL